MSEADSSPNDVDPMVRLRAQLEATRAELAAAADALAARAGAATSAHPEPATVSAAQVLPRAEQRTPPANLPVLYRPPVQISRPVRIAGAVVGVVIFAFGVRRRLLR